MALFYKTYSGLYLQWLSLPDHPQQSRILGLHHSDLREPLTRLLGPDFEQTPPSYSSGSP